MPRPTSKIVAFTNQQQRKDGDRTLAASLMISQSDEEIKAGEQSERATIEIESMLRGGNNIQSSRTDLISAAQIADENGADNIESVPVSRNAGQTLN